MRITLKQWFPAYGLQSHWGQMTLSPGLPKTIRKKAVVALQFITVTKLQYGIATEINLCWGDDHNMKNCIKEL